jgi:hypothetical protein
MTLMTETGQEEMCGTSRGQGRDAEYWALAALTAVGLIWSLSFWQHLVFPNSDYFAFVATGRQWLSFEIPASMKRAPVFSIVAGLGSVLFSHPQAQLAATELYNALLLPESMILFYLVGRGLLGGPGAFVTALLAGISPWLIQMSSEPLAEMTLVVLFAAGVLCVVRGRWRWAYVCAMLASITRWDLTGLIPAVALADWMRNRRLRPALARAVVAALPFLLCMIITTIQLAGQEKGAHYLQVLAEEHSFGLVADLRIYWRVLTAWLYAPPSWPTGGVIQVFRQLEPAIFWVTALLLGSAFLGGCVRGLRQRRPEVQVLLVTAVPYVLVHAAYPYRMPRFCIPMAWAGLILAAYGVRSAWRFLQQRWCAWERVKAVLQVSGTLWFAVWAAGIGLTLKAGVERKVCPGIGLAVGGSVAVAVLGYLRYEWLRGTQRGLRWVTVPVFLVLAIVSSGTRTASLLRDGRQLAGFKTLSLWFRDNAEAGDRMVTTLPHYVRIYAGLPADRFVQTGAITRETAPDFPAFLAACRRLGVTLIAWDSRLVANPQDRYYRLWGLDRISPLKAPFIDRRVTRIASCQLVRCFSEDFPLIAVWLILPEDGTDSGKAPGDKESIPSR